MFYGAEIGFWAYTPATSSLRDVQYAESLGESTTTTTSYQDKTTLTFTPQANTDYIFFWSCDCIAASTTDDVYVRLYNSTDAVVMDEQHEENRTTAGTPYRTAHGIVKYSAGSSPASTTFKIQYYTETGTVTSKIKNARILAVSMVTGDQYTESLADQTTTSNTYVDGATLTFTPATSGDYLIFASCDWNHASTTDLLYLQLLDPSSASIGEMQTHQRDATNYNPWTTMVKQTLAASSQTFKIQVHRTSANTITIRNQRIFAMRLDAGITNAYYAEDRVQASTGSTSYQDDNSLTQTTNAADHLVFNVAMVNSSNSGISVACQFLDDGSTMQGVFEARQNATGGNNCYYPLFVAYKATYTGASHTWKRQYKINSAGFTAYIDEDATAVLEHTV